MLTGNIINIAVDLFPSTCSANKFINRKSEFRGKITVFDAKPATIASQVFNKSVLLANVPPL